MPLTGHVDRNTSYIRQGERAADVVPLTGHVDRNDNTASGQRALTDVVPLTGHVDRNSAVYIPLQRRSESCPSRGTWIEILED